jgi:HNH endonuclease
MNPHYALVGLRAGHRCEYCHAPEAVFNFPFEVEHIIPLVRDGPDAAHNWALACRACNVRKGAHIENVDPVTHAVVRLYHPRQDLWHDHFRVDMDTGVIEGRTAVGRATVARLEMNSPAQCAARQHWIRLGVFP